LAVALLQQRGHDLQEVGVARNASLSSPRGVVVDFHIRGHCHGGIQTMKKEYEEEKRGVKKTEQKEAQTCQHEGAHI
jgi:hypothetical protein